MAIPNSLDKEYSILANHDSKSQKRLQIHMLERNISRTKCTWCSPTISEDFHNYVDIGYSSLKHHKPLQLTHSEKLRVLPVGHFIAEIPRFYIPTSGWINVPEFAKYVVYDENDIIVGYDEKTASHLVPQFKLRSPLQQKLVSDTRMIERGSVCNTRSKGSLQRIAERLGIEPDQRHNVVRLCQDIRAKLIHLELDERRKNTNIKWFYHYWEKQPTQNL